jgi:hypothetical protein
MAAAWVAVTQNEIKNSCVVTNKKAAGWLPSYLISFHFILDFRNGFEVGKDGLRLVVA